MKSIERLFIGLFFVAVKLELVRRFENGRSVVPRIDRLLDGSDLFLFFVQNFLLDYRVKSDKFEFVCQPAAALVQPEN